MRNGNFVFVGGSQGVGKATALAAAGHGASILLIARNLVSGEAAVDEMKIAGAASADFVPADLSTISGMNAAAEAIIGWRPQIHGLMHSAMSAFSTKVVTSDWPGVGVCASIYGARSDQP